MSLVIILSLTLFTIVYYVNTPKHIHVFEMIFVWFIFHYLYGVYIGVLHVNGAWVTLSKSTPHFLSFIILGVVLYPLLIVILLNLLTAFNSSFAKVTAILLWVALLTGLGKVAELLKIYSRPQWELWWSITLFTAIIIISLLAQTWLRKKQM